ncbi:avidin-like isoform 1-T1 [Discoglossus pictus]
MQKHKMVPQLLGVLTLLLVTLRSVTEAKCLLSGSWENDLGSNMTISSVEANGYFTGSYLTSVSTNNNTIVESPIVGYQQTSDQPSFGFSVQWKFSGSVTVFVGQCFEGPDGHRHLYTTWLLRSEAQNEMDDWKATRVGSNIFASKS